MAKVNDDMIINRLVADAAAGDDKAMAQLVAVIMPAAGAKASALNSGYSRISDEDLVQEGMIGFLEAVKKYDPAREVPFRAYASICIESRILSALRFNSNSGNAALSNAVSIDEKVEITSEDPAAIAESGEEMARINQLAATLLSPLEQKVFALRLADKSYSDSAIFMATKPKAVNNTGVRMFKVNSNIHSEENFSGPTGNIPIKQA